MSEYLCKPETCDGTGDDPRCPNCTAFNLKARATPAPSGGEAGPWTVRVNIHCPNGHIRTIKTSCECDSTPSAAPKQHEAGCVFKGELLGIHSCGCNGPSAAGAGEGVIDKVRALARDSHEILCVYNGEDEFACTCAHEPVNEVVDAVVALLTAHPPAHPVVTEAMPSKAERDMANAIVAVDRLAGLIARYPESSERIKQAAVCIKDTLADNAALTATRGSDEPR